MSILGVIAIILGTIVAIGVVNCVDDLSQEIDKYCYNEDEDDMQVF